MENLKHGIDPERDWDEWFGPEGQVRGRVIVPTATIDEDEEEELHGNPDNRTVVDKIWDALRGGDDEYADHRQGKSV